MEKYTSFAVEKTMELLAIDSPTGFTDGAVRYVKEEFEALGLYFSFGGPSTFKNAKKVQDCVRCLPSNRILSETDCPYLTPVPFRGVFPNEPKNVKYIVENMAILRNQNEQELKDQILANARRLFFRLK